MKESQLNEIILAECREEVAKERGHTYDSFLKWVTVPETLSKFETEASLLALDRQAAFFRKISREGYRHVSQTEMWSNPFEPKAKTELELYQLFKEEGK